MSSLTPGFQPGDLLVSEDPHDWKHQASLTVLRLETAIHKALCQLLKVLMIIGSGNCCTNTTINPLLFMAR